MFKIFGRKYVAGIDVTNKCNLRCRHCYHKKYLIEQEDIPLSEWEKRFKKYRKARIKNVVFMGGEPALRYDVLEIAKLYFPFISTFTNGQVKIPGEFNFRIYLSVDGLEKYNDTIRGEGTFNRAMQNYHGDKRVIVHCVLSKENYKDIKGLVGKTREMDWQGIMFSFYTPQINEDSALVLDKKQRLETRQMLLDELRRKDSILSMTKEMIDCLVERKQVKRCAVRENMYAFTADDRLKKSCVTETGDCSRCGCLFACMPPPTLNFPAWLRHKKVIYHRFFKLD